MASRHTISAELELNVTRTMLWVRHAKKCEPTTRAGLDLLKRVAEAVAQRDLSGHTESLGSALEQSSASMDEFSQASTGQNAALMKEMVGAMAVFKLRAA